MRWAIAVLMLLHGLIHLMGAAKGFGLADLRALAEPISTRAGILWLTASLAMAAAAVLFLAAPRIWWVLGLLAVALSQAAILIAWTDARFGTIANAVVLTLALYGFASDGPYSLRAHYREAVEVHLSRVRTQGVLTADDLLHLPAPVQSYIRQSGAVGQPRVTHFRAVWRGRIRETASDPWMEFTAEQYNFLDEPSRFFAMDARRGVLPVDVLHVFTGGAASMKVRLVSVVPLVSNSGADLTRAETVTLFNDLSILAPGALADPGIRWEAIDDASVRAEYTIGTNTIRAVLSFNESGQLVDFASDDRLAASDDGRALTPRRWSTPLSDYRPFGKWTVATRGEGWWHPDTTPPFPYLELQLQDLEINPPD